ncbi:DUF881 domain-containing protein [Bifidobacterium psychraerophilum]|uniref:DUF881 domain-containing protein n=1 Tax=Bifidobacterium psychraerophilum TaxID=218140 RepID=UPI0023EFD827|nr:DUF881 domain-containing protein [Bifidobacterium psychraerophilum]MCI1660728.1 DUF881 domain-containing protein [Bifidobacterium psychraerophilum]MCI1805083.1 DUF881 domain-containing protein [Bifidobacterium psychraerophilum]MCI2175851.1 DUF881 domain-containing protein [Bifidobacterium psychraerophilum]MCI2182530.1 DUF881 domain-containing protein [Bifidobacterium psychraerophilum]
MSEELHMPLSFEVSADRVPLHRRAVFSKSVFSITSWSIGQVSRDSMTGTMRRRKLADESLRLIDDLTNRPVDPMFEDALLTPNEQRSRLSIWSGRVVVFVITLAVGFAGCLIIRDLHQDTRQKVRQELIAQIDYASSRSDNLSTSIDGLRNQIDKLSTEVGGGKQSAEVTREGILNGTTAVKGPGISVTLTDPLAASDDGTASGSSGQSDSSQIRIVSDRDLQTFVSKLWAAGAEAIAINGNRIGVQTSVRTAGSTVLVGVESVQSPYTIEAIGDSSALKKAMSSSTESNLYATLKQAGIYPQVSTKDTITMDAAGSPDLSYAKGEE